MITRYHDFSNSGISITSDGVLSQELAHGVVADSLLDLILAYAECQHEFVKARSLQAVAFL